MHAYKAACRYTSGLGAVLILEDDAEFMRHDADAFADVDDFIHRHECSYTLGSMGSMALHSGNHYRMRLRANVHAVVWTGVLRANLLQTTFMKDTMQHIDQHFLVQEEMFTYKDPLIVQKLPCTANQRDWCMTCRHDIFSRGVDSIFRAITRRWIRYWKLDTSTESWDLVYKANKDATFRLWFGLRPHLCSLATAIGLIAMVVIAVYAKGRRHKYGMIYSR